MKNNKNTYTTNTNVKKHFVFEFVPFTKKTEEPIYKNGLDKVVKENPTAALATVGITGFICGAIATKIFCATKRREYNNYGNNTEEE